MSQLGDTLRQAATDVDAALTAKDAQIASLTQQLADCQEPDPTPNVPATATVSATGVVNVTPDAGATVTIKNSGGTTVYTGGDGGGGFPAGAYTWTATAAAGHVLTSAASGSFSIAQIPPPPTDSYPTYADASVKIPAGTNTWQAVINAHPAGTLFGVTAGSHLFTSKVTPRAGDRFVGQTATGGVPTSLVKGNWNQTSAGTGITDLFNTYPANVQLLRLDISLFAPARSQAAIAQTGPGWVVYNCYLHHNKSAAIKIGSAAKLIGGKVYRNGQAGFFQYGGYSGVPVANGGIVDGVEVFENNFWKWHNWRDEAGAMKFIGQAINMVVRNCHFHNNEGPGIWYDSCGGGGIIENNITENNVGPGIFYEISKRGIIRNNVVRNNGDSGDIYIASSRGDSAAAPIVVEDNEVFSGNTHAGIWLSDDAARPVRLAYVTTRRNKVHRTIKAGVTNATCGVFGTAGANGTTAPGIAFADNEYWVVPGVIWQYGGSKSWAQWKALGFDVNGVLH